MKDAQVKFAMSSGSVKPDASIPRLAFSRAEAAKSLGISTESLDRLVKRGLIRPSRALRRPIFSVIHLQDDLNETII